MHIACPACARRHSLDPSRIGPEGRKVRCAGCRDSWFVDPSTFQAEAVLGEPGPPEASSAPPPTLEKPGLDDLADVEISTQGGMVAAALPHHGPDLSVIDVTPGAAPAVEAPHLVIEPDRSDVVRPSRPAKGKTPPAPRRVRSKALPSVPKPRRPRVAAVAMLVLAIGLPAALVMRASIVRAVPGTASLFASVGLPVNLVGLRLIDVASTLSEENGARLLVVTGTIANTTKAPLQVPPLELTVEGEAGETLYTWSTSAPGDALAPGAETAFRAPLASPPPSGRRVRVVFRGTEKPGQVASH